MVAGLAGSSAVSVDACLPRLAGASLAGRPRPAGFLGCEDVDDEGEAGSEITESSDCLSELFLRLAGPGLQDDKRDIIYNTGKNASNVTCHKNHILLGWFVSRFRPGSAPPAGQGESVA